MYSCILNLSFFFYPYYTVKCSITVCTVYMYTVFQIWGVSCLLAKLIRKWFVNFGGTKNTHTQQTYNYFPWLVWQGCTVDRFFIHQTVTKLWTFTWKGCCCRHFKDHPFIIHLEEDSYIYDIENIKTYDFIENNNIIIVVV